MTPRARTALAALAAVPGDELLAALFEQQGVSLDRGDQWVSDGALDGLPVTPRAFRDAAKARAFPASKRGRRWIALRADVVAWLATPRDMVPSTSTPSDEVAVLASRLGLRVVAGTK